MSLVEKGALSRPGQPISPDSIQNRDQWWHWTRFVSPGGRPGHVGHWSRFVWTYWFRLVGRTGTNAPRPVPPPVVPVGGVNRDQRLPFSPGSWHKPGPISCLYIPLAREQSTPTALFFVAGEERALWCSSSRPMHTRCSMECPSHTT